MKIQKLKLFAFIIASILIISCSKPYPNKVIDDLDNATTPSTSIPEILKTGSWFTGTVSAISYYDRDGHHLDHDYEAGREFIFYENEKKQGRVKFWQYLGLKNYSNCITEIYTLKEGTVAFEGDIFTFYPIKGRFKTLKENCSSDNGTSIREAETEDLQPISYRWEMKNYNGQNLLYTYDISDIEHENVLFIYEKAL